MLTKLTAVLLCGGKGERLHPYTDSIPKPLVELNGKPILYHLTHYLAWHGIDNFVFCTGYKAEMVHAFVDQNLPSSWNMVCVDSGQVSMTDRLIAARAHVPDRFLVCYGDTLANVDLTSLAGEHERSGATTTITAYPMQSPYGVVDIGPGNRVAGFREKPMLPYWINIGFMLCEGAAFDCMASGRDMPDFLNELTSSRSLGAYRHEGRHLTVNTPKDLRHAEVEIREFYTIQNERL